MGWLILVGFLVFFSFWLMVRSRLGNLFSPRVFVLAGLPVLLLMLSVQLMQPYLPVEAKAVPEPLDLSGDFLYTLDGEKVSLEDYRGRLLFLNFWATWCGPCRAEMPSMDALYGSFKDEGLAMLAITDEDPETVRAYLERTPYSFTILLDPEGQLFQRFKVFALPTTLVVDEKNEVLIKHQGGYDWNTDELRARFQKLLTQ